MSKHSEACCQLPPVISEGYEVKGEYKTLNGLKTYVTGPSSATQAILIVYDIFGFTDQILQGADILARSDNEHPYQVYMPDFFQGDNIKLSDFPPQTDEQKKSLNDWLGTTANPGKTQKSIPQCLEAARQSNPDIKDWAALGYCWGGKMISLASGSSSSSGSKEEASSSPSAAMFKAAAQTSPGMVDPKDAETISIPMCVLASKDESAETMKKYEANLRGVKHVETFDQQIHGFMSARADLKDQHVLQGYQRGYQIILDFFHENM